MVYEYVEIEISWNLNLPWGRDPGGVTCRGAGPGPGLRGAGGRGNVGAVPMMVGKSFLHCWFAQTLASGGNIP